MTTANVTLSNAFAVWWKDLDRWVIPTNLILRQSLPRGWQRVRIGQLVRQITDRVKVESEKEYKMAGVRWYGEGVFHRETVRGDGLSASYVTPLVAGALIYNRLFAWKSSFAVVPSDLADCYVSSEFPQFITDDTRLLPEYLYLFCTRETTIRAVNAASTGSSAVSRNRFKEEEFLRFEIPLPPMDEQIKIAKLWKDNKRRIIKITKDIDNLERNVNTHIMETLGICKILHSDIKPKSFGLLWNKMSTWGVAFNRLPGTNADLLRSSLYKSVSLGNVAFINPHSIINFTENEKVSFVPMEAVSDKDGKITSPRLAKFCEVAKGYTRFQDKDILWAKITPCMQNGKSAVAINLQGGIGFGSTEFHIIRVMNADLIIPEYIWIILRMSSVRELATKYFVGSAGQQRVPANFLRELVIPLPPLSIQKKIVDNVIKYREEIARQRETAERLNREINAEVEALVLGLKKI